MAIGRTSLVRYLFECIWVLGVPIELSSNRVRGWYGEWLARKYLKEKKFLILKKNWQSPVDARREIDLIAKDCGCLVFVEVRARSKNSINSGYFTINKNKKKSLLSACKDFLRTELNKYPVYRFDVIEVDLGESDGKVVYHENVSLFP